MIVIGWFGYYKFRIVIMETLKMPINVRKMAKK